LQSFPNYLRLDSLCQSVTRWNLEAVFELYAIALKEFRHNNQILPWTNEKTSAYNFLDYL